MKDQCLCGAVSIEINTVSEVDACHCGMCRRWGGGPYMSIDGGTELTITGEEMVTRYESSEWAERGFCSQCGTHLFYFLKPKQQYFLTAGFFQGVTDFDFNKQIFIDQKPSFYEFANQTENFTEEQVMKLFS